MFADESSMPLFSGNAFADFKADCPMGQRHWWVLTFLIGKRYISLVETWKWVISRDDIKLWCVIIYGGVDMCYFLYCCVIKLNNYLFIIK